MKKKNSLIIIFLVLILILSLSLYSCNKKNNYKTNEIIKVSTELIDKYKSESFHIYGDFDRGVSKYFAVVKNNFYLTDDDKNSESYKNIKNEIEKKLKKEINLNDNLIKDYITYNSNNFLKSFILAELITNGNRIDEDNVFNNIKEIRISYYHIKKIYINDNLTVQILKYSNIFSKNKNDIFRMINEKEIDKLKNYIIDNSELEEITNLNTIVNLYVENIKYLYPIYFLNYLLNFNNNEYKKESIIKTNEELEFILKNKKDLVKVKIYFDNNINFNKELRIIIKGELKNKDYFIDIRTDYEK